MFHETNRKSSRDGLAIKKTYSFYVAKFLVEATIFLTNIDPQIVYKPVVAAKRLQVRRVFQSPLLGLPKTRKDQNREFYTKIRNLWLFYATSKLFVLSIVQLVQREHYRESLIFRMTNPGLKASSPAELIAITNGSNIPIALHIASSISELLGNPLNRLMGASTFLYASLTGNLLQCLYAFSRAHNTVEPLELTHINLFLNHRHEIKRIDLMIDEKLNALLSQIREKLNGCRDYSRIFQLSRQQRQRSGQSEHEDENSLIEHLNECCKCLDGIEYQMSDEALTELYHIIKSLKSQMNTMRPAIYCPQYQLEHSVTFLKILFYVVLFLILPILIVPIQLYINSIKSRCFMYNLKPDECNLRNTFTLQDVLTCIDVNLCMFMITLTFVAQIILIVGSVKSQSISLHSLKLDLEDCLSKLQIKNSLTSKDEDSGRNLNSRQDSCKPSEKKYYEQLKRDTDTILLRTFMKLIMTEDDVRSSSHFISKTLDTFLFSMGFSLILSLICGKLEFNNLISFEIQFLRSSLVIWLLIMSNLVLLYCAIHHSNTIKLDKLIWSVIGQMIASANRSKQAYNRDLIGSYWSKVAHGHSINDARNSVLFFRIMSIDFKRLLELNFIFISMASLMRSTLL